MNDELDTLPEGWAVYRSPGGEHWSVARIVDGEYEGDSLTFLSTGETPALAIQAARFVVEEQERTDRERTEDYARRKAAGQLTEQEIRDEHIAAAWAPEAARMMEQGSVIQNLLHNGNFESGYRGDVIHINVPRYVAIEVKE